MLHVVFLLQGRCLISKVWRGNIERASGKEEAIISIQLQLIYKHRSLTWQKFLVVLFIGVGVHIWGEERMNS